jgi:hypothetical protein
LYTTSYALNGNVFVINMHRAEHAFGPSGLARVAAILTQGCTLRWCLAPLEGLKKILSMACLPC